MKICIPTKGNNGLDDVVGDHFGRVNTYTIIDLETDEVKVISNTSHHMGGQESPPELLKQEGVDILICQGLGRRAIALFEEMGIKVFIGASGLVKEVISSYKQGNLTEAGLSDACGQHAFRDQHHNESKDKNCH